ncbi:MAG TPA: hypothetical protein VM901_01255 [Bdellovibrionota bacterium]|jgi:hypothetical protein|nr:hypothetical protein [Bdellovibrionota bacterium]
MTQMRCFVLATFSLAIVPTLWAQPASKRSLHVTRVETADAKNAEASATDEWKSGRVNVGRDTCIMALMHHARRIHSQLSQTESFLKATIGQAPRSLEWPVEKPGLNRTGSRAKVEETLRSLRAAKAKVQDLAGRNGKNYAVATLAAQSRCEEGMELAELDSALNRVQNQTQSLFDNGYIEMKDTSFEGFSETFLNHIFVAHNELEQLGRAVSAKPQRRLFGLFGSADPHEKAKGKIEDLDQRLRKQYPSAFTAGKGVAGSDKGKAMLAVNAAIVDFVRKNEIGYSDAAQLWKLGLVRDINTSSAPRSSSHYVDDAIVDAIRN